METENTDPGSDKKIKRAEAWRLLLNESLNDPSLLMLLFSNAATIYFAIIEHWSLPNAILVYWMQSVTIGFFTFVKMLQLKNFSTEGFEINGKQPLPTRGTKIQAAFFFLFHYGFFHFGYLIFVLSMFSTVPDDRVIGSILLAGAIFFLNHLFSYLYNKPWAEEKQDLGAVMGLPYVRIIPMHLTIFLAVPAGFFFGAAGVLTVFLVLKTFSDALTHISEHYKKPELATELVK